MYHAIQTGDAAMSVASCVLGVLLPVPSIPMNRPYSLECICVLREREGEVQYNYTCVMITCNADMHHSTLSSCMNTEKQARCV